MTPSVEAGWVKHAAGRYTKQVSATGEYHLGYYRTPWGWRWVLSYLGAHTRTVGYFPTMRAARDYVDVNPR